MNEFQIGILGAGQQQKEVWILREGDDYSLELVNPNGERWGATGSDLFEALKNLRLQIEPLGYLLLCNGARVDAYPSRMSREMTGGQAIYLLEKRGAARKQLFIFDSADPISVGTVAEQQEFYQNWLRIPRRDRLTDRARDTALKLWTRWRDR